MMRIAAAYGAALVVMGVVDAAYLYFIAGKTFRDTLGDVMLADFKAAPALIFYLMYPVGILIFAVLPALEGGRWTNALLMGALFGFFVYLTYDMTNLATLRNWTTALAVQDIAWGTFVTGLTATAAFFAARMVSEG